jgi:hypothetical protein
LKKPGLYQAPQRARLLYLVLATFLVCVGILSLENHWPRVGLPSHPSEAQHQNGDGTVEVGIVSPLYFGEVHTNPKHKKSTLEVKPAGVPLDSTSLLLASHNRVLWHDIETGVNRIIHEGEVICFCAFICFVCKLTLLMLFPHQAMHLPTRLNDGTCWDEDDVSGPRTHSGCTDAFQIYQWKFDLDQILKRRKLNASNFLQFDVGFLSLPPSMRSLCIIQLLSVCIFLIGRQW